LKLCHAGLNVGGGQWLGDSGEIEALRIASKKLAVAGTFTLFDVGANDGSYLKIAREVLGQELRVLAFEPQSGSFRTLEKRFSSNSWLTLNRVALGEEEASSDLHWQSDGDTMASFLTGSIVSGNASETVVVTTLDRVCREAGISRIDFLKIDTEGYELEVLFGARGMINAGRISALQFEFGDFYPQTNHHFLDFWDLLSPKYAFYRILRHGLRALPRYSTDLEIYKSANYLCLLR
jgi:FkbM family methyltransferase